MGKNLQRVQDMVDGKNTGKIIVGQYNPTDKKREIGERWIDSDDKEWEQKDGYRSSVTKINKGIWETCNDCDKAILSRWDKHMYGLHQKCRTCQINFEAILRTYPIKYLAWVRLKQLENMDSTEAEMKAVIFERHEANKNIFDDSVVNAMANANVAMEIKKNT